MNAEPVLASAGLPIAAVERDTGLSKDTLRIWERRYGFPQPLRDVHGERVYPAVQVEKLMIIRRLMDRGHRPGKLMACSPEELAALSTDAAPREVPLPATARLVDLVRCHDESEMRGQLQQALARQGVQGFVMETVAPLNVAVGEAWLRGEIQIFEEHLYTEILQGVLRTAIASLPRRGTGPRVLLTSLPGEQHNLGLLMVEALLSVEGACCIPLGTQTPAADIVRAAAAHRADVVALSFSAAYPSSSLASGLGSLRADLPPSTAIWAGGSGMARMRSLPDGVRAIGGLEGLLQELSAWREARPAC